jgi:hypothetical protein
MADVEVQMQFTTTERKVRKVKKTSKRRESTDNSDVTITEIEKENHITNDHGYVLVVVLKSERTSERAREATAVPYTPYAP